MNRITKAAFTAALSCALLSSSVTSFFNVSAASTVTYKWYNYTTSSSGTYTLSPPSAASTYSIIEDDTRAMFQNVGDEYTGIVHINGIGTGFIVDDHVIATAAHCVYDYSSSSFYNTMYINTYNANGVSVRQSLTAVQVHIPQPYVLQKKDSYDYALITVEEDLSNYMHFDLGYMYDCNTYASLHTNLHITGVPDSIMGYVGLGYIATGSGHLSQQYSSTSSVLRYDIDTTAGESGAPIYTISKFTVGTTESYVFNVIGIHSGTSNDGNPYNRGVRMRPEILKFFKNNSHITY